MSQWPVHGTITGPIVLIGFGSIGRGMLPLIERHFKFDKSRFTVIDPEDKDRHLLDEQGIAFIKIALTRENFVVGAKAASHKGWRPAVRRQFVSRSLIGRDHAALS